MKISAPAWSVESLQGFETYRAANDEVELVVVPELGAKIISLKNLRTRREWLWQPPGGLKLFRNQFGDDFSRSPLAGVDECLPTIAPCAWQGRALPDHGEVWSAPWRVDRRALENGVLKTSVRLKISPLELERAIELNGCEIRLDYQLLNLGARDESFLWALHPLLQLQAGDRLELPGSTRALLNGAGWVDSVDSAIPEKNSAKIFARPVREGRAGIFNFVTGDRLEFIWDAAENDTLGLWLTRGGWHGHHHFAIEPTNAAADALTAAVQKRCGKVAASASVKWQLRLRVSS
jgi:galactose mutarotase-like enzyme